MVVEALPFIMIMRGVLSTGFVEPLNGMSRLAILSQLVLLPKSLVKSTTPEYKNTELLDLIRRAHRDMVLLESKPASSQFVTSGFLPTYSTRWIYERKSGLYARFYSWLYSWLLFPFGNIFLMFTFTFRFIIFSLSHHHCFFSGLSPNVISEWIFPSLLHSFAESPCSFLNSSASNNAFFLICWIRQPPLFHPSFAESFSLLPPSLLATLAPIDAATWPTNKPSSMPSRTLSRLWQPTTTIFLPLLLMSPF